MSVPELSVVVVAAGGEPVHPGLIATLAPALASGRIEVLDVRDEPGERDEQTRLVLAPAGSTVPRRRALGLAAAGADRVAITESFCEPSADWADALLASAGAASAVAVGGPIDRRDGAPGEWASTFCEYGRFLPGRSAGPVADLPGVNVVYDRLRLQRTLGELPAEIFEYELHALLRNRGETLWFEPRAVLYDAGHPDFGHSLRAQRLHGRLHGSRRATEVTAPQRLLRGVAAPAVAPLLFFRLARAAVASRHGLVFARASVLLALLLCAWAAGEGQGYLFGAGGAESAWI